MKQGIFYSRVTNLDGIYVSYPGKPYHPKVKIKPSKDPLIMDMAFKVYDGRLLTFVKELKPLEKKQHKKIKPAQETFDLSEGEDKNLNPDLEVEKKESKEDLKNRSHEDADQELQKLAYDIDPMRKSKGFTMLRDPKTTKKEIFDFIINKRGLYAKWDETVTKDRWISIAMHGYTAEADRSIFKYNTRRLAENWHTKVVLKDLYKSKGAKYDPRLKVAELFEYAWREGWLSRDPHEVMEGAILPDKKED